MRPWTIQLRKGTQVLDHFEATFQECHRKGDEIATRLRTDIEVYAFNEPLRKWQKMGTYHGLHAFTDAYGDARVIKQDYSGMFAKTARKVVRS